jgi:hypothetical protein
MSGYYQKIGSTYYDLNTIYSSYTSGTKADATKFTNSNGIDLNSIFEKRSNQTQNLSVGYSFKDTFQSKYFTPTANCSISSDTGSATISITSAAFNKLAITGSGTATITGVSGTSSYSNTFTGLTPDSNYSYTCKPSNTGTSPDATTTVLDGTATILSTNTLPIIKNVTAGPASATSMTVSWGATGASDCSYSYVTVGRTVDIGGTPTLLIVNGITKIYNSSYSLTDIGLTVGTTYYYTVTPYNNSNIAGTAVTVSAKSPLASVLTTFTFNSVASSTTVNYIKFNVNVSGCSSASIVDDRPFATATSITLTNGAFNGTVDVPFSSSYGTFTLSVYGGISTLTSSKTFTYGFASHSTANPVMQTYSNTTSKYFPYYINYTVIGGGGGGGGGGANQNSGYWGFGGGGGGSGAYLSTANNLSATSQGYYINLAGGGGGAGGGNTNNGIGGNGGDGGFSMFWLYLNGQNTTPSIAYNVLGGGGGRGGAGDGGYDNDPLRGSGGAGGTVSDVKTGYDGLHGDATNRRSAGGAGGGGGTIPNQTWGAGGAGGGGDAYGTNKYSVSGVAGTGGVAAVSIYYVIVP